MPDSRLILNFNGEDKMGTIDFCGSSDYVTLSEEEMREWEEWLAFIESQEDESNA